MARYLEVAAEANTTARQLFKLVTEARPAGGVPDGYTKETYEFEVAQLIAKLVNYGLRCCPRPPQHTVRLRAVERAVQHLPCVVTMKEVTDERSGHSYHALQVYPDF